MRLALIALMIGANASAASLNLLQQDKQMHLATSFGLTLAAERVYVKGAGISEEWGWPLALGTTLALGLAKEGLDREFSSEDMAANVIGGAFASFVCWTF